MDIASEIKGSFLKGSVVTRLIYVNIAVFLLLKIVDTILKLSGFDTDGGDLLLQWISTPAYIPELLTKPWTIITYMFVQFRFLHLLVNMWMLFWFGRIFLQIYDSKQLLGVYVLGGLFGTALYIIMFNTFHFYADQLNGAILLGASGSVVAIIAAAAFGAPQMELQMMFIGRVKLLYVGLAAILIDLISITEANGGGHIAHLGGAFGGYLFISMLKRNTDITRWIVRIIGTIQSWFKPRKKSNMKVKWKRPANEQEYRDQRAQKNDEIDRILDKLKKSGYESLSADEKRKLFDASK